MDFELSTEQRELQARVRDLADTTFRDRAAGIDQSEVLGANY